MANENRIHFIAIGGAAMHNLAIALHKKGYQITGSDDEIFEPSKSRLDKLGLLPKEMGWNPAVITTDLDAIILGMHARADNPELLKAQELGLKIYSYPEYLYEQTKNKTRVVIGGSHGKTTITSMVLHVLKQCNIDADFMVGAQLEGFDTMTKLTYEAKIAIFEGDEYLSSPIDRRPKFHLYKPNVALISGIAWDHINVFPTFENYVYQFEVFTELITPNGTLIYCEHDSEVKKVAHKAPSHLEKVPYGIPDHVIKNGVTILITQFGEIELQIFGDHNLMNMNGARFICQELGVTEQEFYKAIQSFKGASRRLELLDKNEFTTIFKDFAHSPSKLKATTSAVKQQFTNRKLVACMELHTFSSLNKEFLKEYAGAMNEADTAIVYFSPKTVEHKKLESITTAQIKDAFKREDILVYDNPELLYNDLLKIKWKHKNLLLMSSGNFGGVNLEELKKVVLA